MSTNETQEPEVFQFQTRKYVGLEGLQTLIFDLTPGNVWQDVVTGFYYFRPQDEGYGPIGITTDKWYIEFLSEITDIIPGDKEPVWRSGWVNEPAWKPSILYRYIKHSERAKRLEASRPKILEICPNCKFFMPDSRAEYAEKGNGYCRRFPPTIITWTTEAYNSPQFEQHFPYMGPGDFCGEFIEHGVNTFFTTQTTSNTDIQK